MDLQEGNNKIYVGQSVQIVLKQHQRTGELIQGIVKKVLTKSTHHPHGIKVMLESGEIGRVKRIA
ncbi:MAG: YwbE family protein [Bacteroidetes bacterium]|nr:YwbE family protein [Bacteroidota bacterium]